MKFFSDVKVVADKTSECSAGFLQLSEIMGGLQKRGRRPVPRGRKINAGGKGGSVGMGVLVGKTWGGQD